MVELLGILATLVVLLGFTKNNIKMVRIYDAVGAIMFIIYGALIGSISVCLLNGALVIVNIIKLKQGK